MSTANQAIRSAVPGMLTQLEQTGIAVLPETRAALAEQFGEHCPATPRNAKCRECSGVATHGEYCVYCVRRVGGGER